MAYYPRYEAVFTNELQQEVAVQILLKDVEGEVQQFTVAALEIADSSDENVIIARELTMTIFADSETLTWDTLLADSYDQWMIVVMVDGQYWFRGFLTPEEGEAPFHDQPYDVRIRATNGIKLLKDVPLTKQDGELFHGKFTLLEFLVAALQKTLLEADGAPLPIRIYGSWYNADMDTRQDDIAATYWNQVKHDHRTYMKDATTFESCYNTLLILLDRHSRIFYWNDKWVVFLLGEHQYRPEGLYYTDFTGEGELIGGYEDTEGAATVGKNEAIYPINEDVRLSASYPVKFTKTQFDYEAWPELPLNSKFERGTRIGFGYDADGNRYEDYSIDDWTSGRIDDNPSQYSALPNFITPNTDPWFRRSTYNQYGVEINREVIINNPLPSSSNDGSRWVQSEGMPVKAGSKVRFSFDYRADVDLSESEAVPVQLIAYVKPVTGNKMWLRGPVGGVLKWVTSQGIGIYTTPNQDLTLGQSISVESPEIPVDGSLYVAMLSAEIVGGGNVYYKNFSMEYVPYVSGGFIPITGDYWSHRSEKNQLDADEGRIRISDSVILVLKGVFFSMDGVTALSPTWFRLGVTESRHFKELANLARYNIGYRRFRRIEGPFTGLVYSPVNDQLAMQPIGFHKEYRFLDYDQPRDFALVTPFKADLCTGDIEAVFEEVVNPAMQTNYGANIQHVINALIALVAAEFSGATLERLPPDVRLLKLTSAEGDTISASADDNGAGNSPTFLVNTQFDDGGVHVALLTLEPDIAIGNIFTITMNGTSKSYEAVDAIVQSDGTQLADDAEFKYVFSNTRR